MVGHLSCRVLSQIGPALVTRRGGLHDVWPDLRARLPVLARLQSKLTGRGSHALCTLRWRQLGRSSSSSSSSSSPPPHAEGDEDYDDGSPTAARTDAHSAPPAACCSEARERRTGRKHLCWRWAFSDSAFAFAIATVDIATAVWRRNYW